jgi:hypothetical protein
MAQQADDYCPDVAQEVKDARKATFEDDVPEKPHYTTEEKLMSPGPGPDDEM